jgi:hypothetical protein
LLTSRSTRGRVQGHTVAPQRGFGFDSTDNVVPGVLIEVGASAMDDFMEIEEFVALRRCFQQCGFIELFRGHFTVRVAGCGK